MRIGNKILNLRNVTHAIKHGDTITVYFIGERCVTISMDFEEFERLLHQTL